MNAHGVTLRNVCGFRMEHVQRWCRLQSEAYIQAVAMVHARSPLPATASQSQRPYMHGAWAACRTRIPCAALVGDEGSSPPPCSAPQIGSKQRPLQSSFPGQLHRPSGPSVLLHPCLCCGRRILQRGSPSSRSRQPQAGDGWGRSTAAAASSQLGGGSSIVSCPWERREPQEVEQENGELKVRVRQKVRTGRHAPARVLDRGPGRRQGLHQVRAALACIHASTAGRVVMHARIKHAWAPATDTHQHAALPACSVSECASSCDCMHARAQGNGMARASLRARPLLFCAHAWVPCPPPPRLALPAPPSLPPIWRRLPLPPPPPSQVQRAARL